MVVLLAAVLIAAANAPTYAVVQAGALLLQYPGHPRLVSMGQTGVADNSDPSTIYYNPANAAAEPRAYLAASKMEWPDGWFWNDLWVGRANGGFTWRGDGERAVTWGVNVSLAKFDYGESIATEPDGTPLGTFEMWEKAASVAVAFGIRTGERFELRFGTAAKRWWAEFPSAQFTQDVVTGELDAYAFDAGVTVVLRSMVGDWSVHPALAVAIVDAGPDFDTFDGHTDPLPTRLNFGLGAFIESPTHRLLDADVPVLTVAANLDATDQRHGGHEWGIGTELSVAQVLFLSTGVHAMDQDYDDETWSAWGIGLGLPVSSLRVRFDYTESDYYSSSTTKHMGVTASWLF